MNYSAITRIERANESTGKYRWSQMKNTNGDKRRRISEYNRLSSQLKRRKQTKPSYDTYRRPDIPDQQDMHLDNWHYANFLGDKLFDKNKAMMYSDRYDAFTVNINFCDLYLDYLEDIRILFGETTADEEINFQDLFA